MYNNNLGTLIDQISCEDAPPITELHQALDDYEKNKNEIKNLEAELEKLSGLYRVIQKRLLLRFKDKNPAPLNNLDGLLNSTYYKIIAMANQIEQAQKEFNNSCLILSITLETLFLLLRIQAKFDQKTYDTIRSYFAVNQM